MNKILSKLFLSAVLFSMLYGENAKLDSNGNPTILGVDDNSVIRRIKTNSNGELYTVIRSSIPIYDNFYKDKEYRSKTDEIYSSSDIEIKGYPVNMYFKCYGTQATISGNWIDDSKTIKLYDRESFDDSFWKVPLSSPTIINLSLLPNTTLVYYIGYLK